MAESRECMRKGDNCDEFIPGTIVAPEGALPSEDTICPDCPDCPQMTTATGILPDGWDVIMDTSASVEGTFDNTNALKYTDFWAYGQTGFMNMQVACLDTTWGLDLTVDETTYEIRGLPSTLIYATSQTALADGQGRPADAGFAQINFTEGKWYNPWKMTSVENWVALKDKFEEVSDFPVIQSLGGDSEQGWTVGPVTTRTGRVWRIPVSEVGITGAWDKNPTEYAGHTFHTYGEWFKVGFSQTLFVPSIYNPEAQPYIPFEWGGTLDQWLSPVPTKSMGHNIVDGYLCFYENEATYGTHFTLETFLTELDSTHAQLVYRTDTEVGTFQKVTPPSREGTSLHIGWELVNPAHPWLYLPAQWSVEKPLDIDGYNIATAERVWDIEEWQMEHGQYGQPILWLQPKETS